ncbi:hypothetical protein B0P06_004699 [Clostridium saccharoperbutylacetonicum]|nr:hypothetical protein [Clostridium saccharoperbutylacetonicum]NSB44928.1 hypothetical protein [Clostridium saccharoperbutylacetonicum]
MATIYGLPILANKGVLFISDVFANSVFVTSGNNAVTVTFVSL